MSRQQTLLYLALLFHEFGHVLYAAHLPEMKDLVKEFQRVVADHLAPVTLRDRPGASREGGFRRDVVCAWYPWVQEFFCDAVGLIIGGPAYIKAFSHYFRVRDAENYYLPRAAQLKRRHPVTWLRARMLADRAKSLGMADLGCKVDAEWRGTAGALGVDEDYDGTWSEDLFQPLRRTLTDMLEESQPLRFRQQDLEATVSVPTNPITLFNQAWSRFEADPKAYRPWERSAIDGYLKVL